MTSDDTDASHEPDVDDRRQSEGGSRCYGGDGGFVIGDRRFMASYDFDDGGDLSSLTVTNPPTDTASRIEAAVKRGAPFHRDGDGVRWWVGGCTH